MNFNGLIALPFGKIKIIYVVFYNNIVAPRFININYFFFWSTNALQSLPDVGHTHGFTLKMPVADICFITELAD